MQCPNLNSASGVLCQVLRRGAVASQAYVIAEQASLVASCAPRDTLPEPSRPALDHGQVVLIIAKRVTIVTLLDDWRIVHSLISGEQAELSPVHCDSICCSNSSHASPSWITPHNRFSHPLRHARKSTKMDATCASRVLEVSHGDRNVSPQNGTTSALSSCVLQRH